MLKKGGDDTVALLSLDCRTEENEAVVRDSTFGCQYTRVSCRVTALEEILTRPIDLVPKCYKGSRLPVLDIQHTRVWLRNVLRV